VFVILRNKESDYPEIAGLRQQVDAAIGEIHKLVFPVAEGVLEQALAQIQPLKDAAVAKKDETTANGAFLLKVYLVLLKDFIAYHGFLQSGKFAESWDKLQDCMDHVSILKKFMGETPEIQDIAGHLLAFEGLYPYRLFASSEILASKQTCSICGLSSVDPLCEHVPGELYWGELAFLKNHGQLEIRGIAFVERPQDKRCVMRLDGGELPFNLLEYYLEKVKDPLLRFSVQIFESYEKKNKRELGRNDPCFCGSGKKYKKCCGKESFEINRRGHIEMFGIRLSLPTL
jgi:hypothetical protein